MRPNTVYQTPSGSSLSVAGNRQNYSKASATQSLAPCTRTKYHTPVITIGQTELKNRFSVQLLRERDLLWSQDQQRLDKANSPFGRLYKRMWNNDNLKKDTKKLSCWPPRPHVRCWILGHLSPPPARPREFSVSCAASSISISAAFDVHWSDFIANIEVTRNCKGYQCRGHASQSTAALTWARIQDGGP